MSMAVAVIGWPLGIATAVVNVNEAAPAPLVGTEVDPSKVWPCTGAEPLVGFAKN